MIASFHSRRAGVLLALASAAALFATVASSGDSTPGGDGARIDPLAGSAANQLDVAGRALAEVTALVSPSVVHILSERDGQNGGSILETGSGIIIYHSPTTTYHVVTNRHVVRDAALSDIDIHLHDGRVIHPVQRLEDAATDVAVLRINDRSLTAASWGDSDNVEIGHFVLAMGSPFGLSQSVTLGIISAKGRRALDLGGSRREVINQDFLQTDAAINPGNSGGPLVDMHGRVVGINTAIASQGGGNEGIGFSIPSNLVHFVMNQLVEHGRVPRGYLGVVLDEEFDLEAAQQMSLDRLYGARVTEVYDGTPAALAGVLVNDVILNFDGFEVEDENHLIHLVSLTAVNKTVRLQVLRGRQIITLNITLTERPAREARSEAPANPGLPFFRRTGWSVHQLNDQLAVQLGYAAGQRGVLVMEAAADASEDELQAYDVIEEIARRPVANVDEFESAWSDLPHDQPVIVKVRRLVDGEPVSRLLILEAADSSAAAAR
jgi:serine protease Do